MCLYIKENTGINIAEKDIVCYKAVFTNFGSIIAPCILNRICDICDIEGFVYKPDYFDDKATNQVEHGIHIYSSLSAFIHICSMYDACYECVIPKGSRYYIGQCGDYCSEQIIFKNRVKFS